MSKDCLIIQFAKFPRLGAVKTRLQGLLTEQGSYDLHIKLLTHVNQTIEESGFNHVLALDKLGELECINSIAKQTPILLQQGHDLGAKMQAALNWGLKRYQKVVIVGSDCPVLDAEFYAKVCRTLDEYDQVFIPAEDGGYVLIAAKTINPVIFKDMPWGTGEVMTETKSRLDQQGKAYKCLAELWDVDRPEDYQRLVAINPTFNVL